jgi:autotransporter-associated beta strand protein
LGGAVFVQGGGNLIISGNLSVNGNTVSGGAAGGSGAVAGGFFGSGMFLNGSGTLNFQPGAGQIQTMSDAIADQNGSGGSALSNGVGGTGGVWALALSGGGTLALSGDNTYSGGTTVSGGTLTLGNNNALGTGSLSLAAGTTLSFANTGSFNIANNISISGDPTITTIPGTPQTISGVISDGAMPGDVVVNGGGALTLSGQNTYSGGTTISGSGTTLQVGVNTFFSGAVRGVIVSSAIGTGTLTFDGGTLQSGGNGFVIGNAGVITANGGTIDSNGNTITYSGVIGDASGVHGALTITDTAGGGTVMLSGANTYSGGTTISGSGSTLEVGAATVGSPGAITSSAIGTGTLTFNGGTLQAGDNFTIANAGVITANGGTIDSFSNILTYSGAIGDASGVHGALTITDSIGSGTVVLSGQNTYSGATNVGASVVDEVTLKGGATNTFSANSAFMVNTSATLDLGGFNQTIGSLAGSGTVTNSGAAAATLTAGGDNTSTTFSGVIQDGASTTALTKLGTGTLTLFGANTYTGATMINGGTLLGRATNAFSAASATTINTGGTLDLGGFAQTINTVSLAGGTLQNGALTGAVTSIGGTINGLNGTATLTTTAGSTTVTGINGFTGATTVNGGTLEVDGSIASSSLTTVNTGGTLSGTGTVGATQINTGGALVGGNATNPTGTLTISGSLAFQSGALYVVAVTPASASSVTVSGTATLNGSVQTVFAPGSYVTKSYDILHTGGLRGTTFTGISGNLPAGFSESLSYTTTDVMLNLTLNTGNGSGALGASGLNRNQQNAANAISTFFNNGGALPPGFVNLVGLTGSSLSKGLSQVSGESATGAEKGVFQMTTQFLDLLLDPWASGRSGGGSASGFAPEQQASLPPDIALAYASVLKAPATKAPANFDARWNVWGSAFGGTSNTGGNSVAGTNNLTAGDYGVAAGADYRVTPNTVVGFALAGGGTNWNLAQGLGGGRSDAFQAGLYSKSSVGPAYVSAALSFANHWFTTSRTVLGDQLTASFEGQDYSGRIEGGYRFALPVSHASLGLTPYAALQTQLLHTPGYTETDLTGGGFGLGYGGVSATDTRSEIGARFDSLQLLGTMPLILRARAAWAHDWVSDPALQATFQALPGSSFIVNGAALPADSALITASAELRLNATWSLLAKFDGEFASNSQTYAGTGTLRASW